MDEERLEFYRTLFDSAPFFALRHESDDELETDLNYVVREIVETKLKKDKETRADFTAWYKVLLEEKERRIQLAKHGAPKYRGEDRVENIGQVVAHLKQYYTGDIFANLFQEVTGFEVFSYGGGSISRMKYRCTIHGDDRSPSGVLYLNEGRYHCFGCNAGGDIFQLLMIFPPHRTFMDAVEWLAARIPEYARTQEGTWKRK